MSTNVLSKISLEKFAFVIGLTVLSFFLGFTAHRFEWIPSETIDEAVDDGTKVIGRPHFTHPRVYEETGVRTHHPDSTQPGLILVAGIWKDFGSQPGIRIIDRDGSTKHQWKVDPARVFSSSLPKDRVRRRPRRTNIHGMHLYPDGDIVFNISYIGTVRMDACGNVEWRLPLGSHHSVEPSDDGSLWISGGSWKPKSIQRTANDSTKYKGLGDRLYYDRIMRVSPKGELLEEFELLDILYQNELERRFKKSSRYRAHKIQNDDVTHINDIEPLSGSIADQYPSFDAGDLAVSVHRLDLVFVFDPDTGQVEWHEHEPWIQQHDPDFIGNGWIGVFDNNRDGTRRGSMLGGSRVVAVHPETGEQRVLFPGSESDPFHTQVQGEWQQLPNGNLLLTESQAGRIVEVGPDGRRVWDWVAKPYDTSHSLELSDAYHVELSEEQIQNWTCAD